MMLIVGTFRIPAKMIGTARPPMKQMVEASQAEQGCLEYVFAEDLLDAGLIHVKELWTSQEALDRHNASPHMALWRREGTNLSLGEKNLRLYADIPEPRQI